MELWEPIVFNSPSVDTNAINDDIVLPKAEEEEGFNFSFFYSDEANIKGNGSATEADLEKKAKRSTRKPADATTLAVVNPKPEDLANNTNIPYIATYNETDNLVRGTIIQIDKLSSDIASDIDKIRSSSSMKGKYTYITNLSTASASLISSRLNAIKELNSTITNAHNLELKRSKDLKSMELEKKNDDARMMDMYSAFINTPMGMYDNKLNMPTIPDMMVGVNDPTAGIKGVSMQGGGIETGQVSPEQIRMRMEGNSNIEEIVVFDPSTGRKWFDVIDKSTGQSVPNYPRTDSFMLEDVSVETRAGIAKNRNIDKVWPLRVVGSSSVLDEY